ncbi:MAG: hypothetical protein ACREQ5_22175, partial [Candidatus Dormibacteria bacterium]
VPVLTGVQPQVLLLQGQQPLHLTVSGSNLSGVISVTLVPAVVGIGFTLAGPSSLALTLPASTPPDTYTLFVTATSGASDPGSSPTFTVGYPVAPVQAAPPPPKYSFAPTPQDRYEPTTGVIDPGVTVRHATPAAPAPLNPLMLLPLGIVLGGLGYLLWGRPGRLAAAGRQGIGAHLVGRPVQALHLGRICLQCGRLHFVLGTRRDLWRAGRFCSATCFVAAQEDDSAARAGESTAVTRMREMFVYSELEQSLQAALAGDVEALEHAAALGDPQIEAVLAPNG